MTRSVERDATRRGIRPERVSFPNDEPVRTGRYVLYWMQASQRTEWNHALAWATLAANDLRVPLLVCFCVVDAYGEATVRQYGFMLRGLAETAERLAARGAGFVMRRGDPAEVVGRLARDARLVVTDRGYTRTQRAWRDAVAAAVPCRCVTVESDVVVPVRAASNKTEYAARTIRPKIHRLLDEHLVPLRMPRLRVDGTDLRVDGLDPSDPDAVLAELPLDRTVAEVDAFRPGPKAAKRRLRRFLDRRLDRYDEENDDPEADGTSGVSPYLHFGQISPLRIALAVRERSGAGAEAFFEQLVVRRELAVNFVFHDDGYDVYDTAVPDWARATLEQHRRDRREYVYDADAFERADTHDPYWNAAQRQLVRTGWMHNRMRMYWGKKIIEWTESPRDAFALMLRLNDRYQLDGRDPNGYAGVAWCFGTHDRPWTEREIFGNVRYMNAAGLRRTFDADAYAARYGQ